MGNAHAGIAAETVPGQTWHELIEERIFDPLKMERSTSLREMIQGANYSRG
jgi:CubicO group peptidase (beta-lactamase class C family)